jgi:hypothetical protein
MWPGGLISTVRARCNPSGVYSCSTTCEQSLRIADLPHRILAHETLNYRALVHISSARRGCYDGAGLRYNAPPPDPRPLANHSGQLRRCWPGVFNITSGPGYQHMAPSHIYKIIFMYLGKVYEIYARSIGHGDLFGFIEVEELVFGARTTVVVDPSEEKIQAEFEGVKRTYIPMHAVMRIDEVEKQGVSKISDAEGGNVTQFPMPVYTPGGRGGDRGK